MPDYFGVKACTGMVLTPQVWVLRQIFVDSGSTTFKGQDDRQGQAGPLVAVAMKYLDSVQFQ